MKRNSILVCACAAITGLMTTAVLVNGAEPAQPGQPPEKQMSLPPGWTEADMKAALEATMPGEQQKRLMQDAGAWRCKNTMWMTPGGEPVVSDNTCIDTIMMDGRYLRSEWAGHLEGMGPFIGFGLKGYDNAGGKFVSSWIDSMSTGIMQGTGELSADGKTINWTFHHTCPLTKKPVVMRQIETWQSEKSKTLEMWGPDPKTGKEFKMMFIEMTKKI